MAVAWRDGADVQMRPEQCPESQRQVDVAQGSVLLTRLRNVDDSPDQRTSGREFADGTLGSRGDRSTRRLSALEDVEASAEHVRIVANEVDGPI
jgi:hypothetical protein